MDFHPGSDCWLLIRGKNYFEVILERRKGPRGDLQSRGNIILYVAEFQPICGTPDAVSGGNTIRSSLL